MPSIIVPVEQLSISTTAPTIDRALNDDNYTGDEDNLWHGGILGGIPVINNGIDIPQVWNPPNASTRLTDLPNWPDGVTAKVVKPFLNFLIALNITESGVDKPHMYWWSHGADPGTIPNSWDQTDATKDAGRAELTDTNAGLLRDAEVLDDQFIMYKDNSTHSLRFVGGQFIWKRSDVFTRTGILAQRCVIAIPTESQLPTRHVVATGDDVIVHNGRVAESILDRKMRKFLNSNLDSTNFRRSYMALNKRQDEVWFCFVTNGADFPTLALVWNYKDDTIGVRNLTNAAFINAGVVGDTSPDNSWDGQSGSWDEAMGKWNSQTFNPQEIDLLQCNPIDNNFLHLDKTNQFNGMNITSTLERTGLLIIGVDKFNKPIVNMTRRKLATRVWPRMTGGPVNIQVGSQETIKGPVTWATAKVFTPGVDNYVDFLANGRLLAIRFESLGDVAWTLDGYDINVEELGEI